MNESFKVDLRLNILPCCKLWCLQSTPCDFRRCHRTGRSSWTPFSWTPGSVVPHGPTRSYTPECSRQDGYKSHRRSDVMRKWYKLLWKFTWTISPRILRSTRGTVKFPRWYRPWSRVQCLLNEESAFRLNDEQDDHKLRVKSLESINLIGSFDRPMDARLGSSMRILSIPCVFTDFRGDFHEKAGARIVQLTF